MPAGAARNSIDKKLDQGIDLIGKEVGKGLDLVGDGIGKAAVFLIQGFDKGVENLRYVNAAGRHMKRDAKIQELEVTERAAYDKKHRRERHQHAEEEFSSAKRHDKKPGKPSSRSSRSHKNGNKNRFDNRPRQQPAENQRARKRSESPEYVAHGTPLDPDALRVDSWERKSDKPEGRTKYQPQFTAKRPGVRNVRFAHQIATTYGESPRRGDRYRSSDPPPSGPDMDPPRGSSNMSVGYYNPDSPPYPNPDLRVTRYQNRNPPVYPNPDLRMVPYSNPDLRMTPYQNPDPQAYYDPGPPRSQGHRRYSDRSLTEGPWEYEEGS